MVDHVREIIKKESIGSLMTGDRSFNCAKFSFVGSFIHFIVDLFDIKADDIGRKQPGS